MDRGRDPESARYVTEAGSDDALVPPLVIADGDGELAVFDSEAELLAELEPWFANENYRAYDATGRMLELVADPPVVSRRIFGWLHTDNAGESRLLVRIVRGEPRRPGELAHELSEWLARVEGRASGELPLAELVERAVQVTDSWRSRRDRR